MATVRDLVKAGLIYDGEQLEWIRPTQGIVHFAKVSAIGVISTSDGVSHKSPSGAARHYYQKPINGWAAWKVIRTGKSLAETRKLFINQF